MEQDERARQFEQHRKRVISLGERLFPRIEPDILDMLYTDRWESISKADITENLQKYIQTAFLNGVRNYIRQKKTSQDLFERGIQYTVDCHNSTDDDSEYISLIDSIQSPNPDESIQFEAKCQWVEDAMKHIPITLRLIGWWSIVDGEPHREIAKRFNCTKQNISLKLIQFRKLLKIALDKCPQP
jgi:RNA polymerase sigma factor (sigma-70 family)